MINSFTLEPATSEQEVKIEALLDTVFGPGRKVRMAERLREGNAQIEGLSYVGMSDEQLIAAISYWPIKIGETEAILLGPLVVATEWRGNGVGHKLMSKTLQLAAKQGHHLVMLVGDESYYKKAGFERATSALSFLGSVDPKRVLVKWLGATQPKPLSGLVQAKV